MENQQRQQEYRVDFRKNGILDGGFIILIREWMLKDTNMNVKKIVDRRCRVRGVFLGDKPLDDLLKNKKVIVDI